MTRRLVLGLGVDGMITAAVPGGEGFTEQLPPTQFAWPLGADALEDLRWYLEDYLLAPFGVWEDRGPGIAGKLAGWGDLVSRSLLGDGPVRFAYERARDKGLEVVIQSADPGLLGLPWELMRDGAGPVALRPGGLSRSLSAAGGAGTLEVPGGRLRVLMVISRPAGIDDIRYQMVARPLLERLDAVRGDVDLSVLRPPTFKALRQTVTQAADSGHPFHIVHFDGHGMMRRDGAVTGRPGIVEHSEGVLAFELPDGGIAPVAASRLATALADGRVPVMVLNACQSGAMGKELEASVATALLRAGCSAVVAMAYRVYAVAAAEFMTAFYESLFTGDSVGQAVTAGRRHLAEHDGRPSPRGDMPLADWLVPVHYLRKEVSFPQVRAVRPATELPLGAALDKIRAAPSGKVDVQDPLAAAGVFVGRDDLFYRIETSARRQRVVLLTGPGGTGKTEMAKGFARWWRDTGGIDDPQLVLWHSFEPGMADFSLDGVITGIGLAVLGVEFARLNTPRQRLDAVKEVLVRSRALLIWDNFETVRDMPGPVGAAPLLNQEGCAAIKRFLDWVREQSASVVLITSRTREDWLGDAARIMVGGLDQAEAAQYASYLLAPFPTARQRREHRSFGELLDWLDGHPLAMRLTLPYLAETGPGELLAGLRGTSPLPGGDAPDTSRADSLPASITYSYTHLSDRTRKLLSVVALLQGIADAGVLEILSAAAGVPEQFAGVSRQEWEEVLDDAAKVGLLTSIGGGLYLIHPALPGYLAIGWQTADPVGYTYEREACERALIAACAYYSQLLIRDIEVEAPGLARRIIGLHGRTLSTILGHALERQAWDYAAAIVEALDEYWETRGLIREAAAWGDRILDATAGPGQLPINGAISLWLHATVYQAARQEGAGELDQAKQSRQRALDYLQRQPETESNRRRIASLYHQLGVSAYYQERLDEAEDWYRKSLTISDGFGNRVGVASTYHQLGITAQVKGRMDEAEDWYRKALTIKEDLRDQPGIAATYHQLGTAAQARRRLDEAEDWYRKALTIKEDLHDQPGMASTYHQLGRTACLQGRLDEAEDWFRTSLTIEERLGNRPSIARNYSQLGIVAYYRRRLDESDDWCRKALVIQEDLGSRPGMESAYSQLGINASVQGRLDEAEDWFRKALTISEDLGNRPGIARAYSHFGMIAETRGQFQTALQWNIRSVGLSGDFSGPLTGPVANALARLADQMGMPAFEHAWRQLTGQSLPHAIRDRLTRNPPGGTQ